MICAFVSGKKQEEAGWESRRKRGSCICTVGELVCMSLWVCVLYTRIFLHVSAMLLYACLYMCAGVQLSIYLM